MDKVDVLWNYVFGKATPSEEPTPVKYYREKSSGRLVPTKMLDVRNQMEKIAEELLEATWEAGVVYGDADDSADIEPLAIEVADIITASITLLENLGYDRGMRAELYRKVNEKNGRRGYLG